MTRKTTHINKLERLLTKALASDRYAARKELSRIKKLKANTAKDGKNSDKNIENRCARLEKSLKASISKKRWRIQNSPKLSYNNALPITAKKDEIIRTISENRVTIISGETGSGKTTQIPKFCLAAGRGINGVIGCTQPRRIAAITVANRISEELGEHTGQSVGHKIRFQDNTGDDAFIKIMTDGILLAETQGDPYLNMYDTLIIDEAHERSLNIDFVLGILKTLLKKRRDLKIIITSATIDTEKFSKAFDNAPVIEVSGRMYPVDLEYFSLEDEKYEDKTHVELAAAAVDKIIQKSVSGDILLFMPTEQDIRETQEQIEGRNHRGVSVLPLFARLAASQQTKVYSRVSGRKIIVATNIAETSLTIPGIKYVIDTGLARISQYIPRSGTTALPVVPISRSSADQRKGRCGRVEHGICIRLYSEEDYLNRPLFTLPEILRANLAEVILRMIAIKIGDISAFPFIDRPPQKSIKDGFDTLFELGAIVVKPKAKNPQNRFQLTSNGVLMAKLPIDPRLSRILIEAKKEKCIKEAGIIVSALSIQDPRERPAEKAQAADQAHAAFSDHSSDFITLLNIWYAYVDEFKRHKSNNRMKKFCKKHWFSFRRMREWRDIHGQILTILKENNFNCPKTSSGRKTSGVSHSRSDSGKQNDCDAFTPFYSALHKSILSGYLSSIAVKKEKNIFNAAKEREVMIFPGSGLFNNASAWIVSAEIVETSRLFARAVANIDNSWLEALGDDLCKYTYIDPHWSKSKGQVVASCQVSLFGLIVGPPKIVPFGPIAPDEASSIFIRKALVEGDVKQPWFNKSFAFMAHNQALIEDVKSIEDKIRRRDVLISDEDLFEFYNQRLDAVYDIKTLKQWLKNKKTDSSLKMRKDDIVKSRPDDEELALFPKEISLGTLTFNCQYKFTPGQKDDGVTVKIPADVVSVVPPEATDWLVPGLYQEKLTTLIKGLPKEYRKQLVPVANTVDIIVQEMPKAREALLTALGQFIFKRFGVDIPASVWPEEQLPDHLKMRIAITGSNGKTLISSREKDVLEKTLPDTGENKKIESDEFIDAKKMWEKKALAGWDFPDLPESVCLTGKTKKNCVFYPGLDLGSEKGIVNLILFSSKAQADAAHEKGVEALFLRYFTKELKFFKKTLVLTKPAAGYAKHFKGQKAVERRMYQKVVSDLFCRTIRTQKEFDAHMKAVAPLIQQEGLTLLNKTTTVLEAYHEARFLINSLEKANPNNFKALEFLAKLRNDLNRLVPETFIEIYDTIRLDHVVRYIKAIGIRAQRGLSDFIKDRNKAKDVDRFNNRLNRLMKEISPRTSEEKREEMEAVFWLIEEYKVSVFAQELKTPVPVSIKRLDKKFKEIERMI